MYQLPQMYYNQFRTFVQRPGAAVELNYVMSKEIYEELTKRTVGATLARALYRPAALATFPIDGSC